MELIFIIFTVILSVWKDTFEMSKEEKNKYVQHGTEYKYPQGIQRFTFGQKISCPLDPPCLGLLGKTYSFCAIAINSVIYFVS